MDRVRSDVEAGTARVEVHVPAKVNLFLAVRGLRSDGYHEVVTVLQTVSVKDTVSAVMDVDPSAYHPAARRLLKVAFTHDSDARVPSDDSNLAMMAASALLEKVGGNKASNGETPNVVTSLHLSKRIPVAAGMAGGSADAAATLIALNELWDCGLDRDELKEIAAGIGADVPFCVTGGTALATGTGTATAQVLCRGTFHWVVGMSDEPLSTAEVYRVFDDVGASTDLEPDDVVHALGAGDIDLLAAALHNDLEQAAIHIRPQLATACEAMRTAGALAAVVSGSGPTVVGLARDADHAQHIADAVTALFDRIATATSPAGGPHIAGKP